VSQRVRHGAFWVALLAIALPPCTAAELPLELQGRLKATTLGIQAKVHLTNTSGGTLLLHWVDNTGRLSDAQTLNNGDTVSFEADLGTPHVLVDPTTGVTRVFFPDHPARRVIVDKAFMTATVFEIDFAAKSYVDEPFNGRAIHYEQELVDDTPAYTATKEKLLRHLAMIDERLPRRVARALKDVDVFMMYGSKSTSGGLDSGGYYWAEGSSESELIPEIVDNSVMVLSSENYLYLDDLWSLKVLMHEFAHAFHAATDGGIDEDLKRAYANAIASDLYGSVRHTDGTDREAYAQANHLEYFAELVCAYFAETDYYPTNRAGLREHDPVGHEMIGRAFKASNLTSRP